MKEKFWRDIMDKIDIQIISILQKNARTSVKEIAEKVYLSSPAAAARIAKLEERGIIIGYTAKVDIQKAGGFISAFFTVRLRDGMKNEFTEFVSSSRNVMECCCVTGEASMIIKGAFPSTALIEAFADELEQFGKTTVQVVFTEIVSNRSLNIDI